MLMLSVAILKDLTSVPANLDILEMAKRAVVIIKTLFVNVGESCYSSIIKTELFTFLILVRVGNCWQSFEHHNWIVNRISKGAPLR